jgi:hypothetical protein
MSGVKRMTRLEQMARAALERDSLGLREMALEFLSAFPKLEAVPEPEFTDPRLRAIAAGLVELFAVRRSQASPAWTRDVSRTEPFFLVRAAERMPRLRALCEAESPEPLKRRGFYAPPNFLEFA